MAVLKRSTFFTALFCLVVGQVRSESEPPRCWKEMQYEGTIIAEKENVETPYRCLEFCQGTPGCKFFTHYSSRNSCFAFSDAPDSDYDCRGDCISGEVSCELTCNAVGLCGGNSFLIEAEFAVFDTQQCQRDCQANEECQWYTFSLDAHECWLWKNCDGLSTSLGYFTGQKECPIGPLCNVEGKCSDDSSLVGFNHGGINSPEECLKECQANEECTWYSFDPKKNDCYWWDRCDDLQSDGETISGEQICPTEPDDVPQCDVPGTCEGVVVREYEGITKDMCLRGCYDNDKCEWFTFNEWDNFCIHWADCTLIDEAACSTCISGQKECDDGHPLPTTTEVPSTTPEDLDCGGLLSGLSGAFTSVNYPRVYPLNTECTWTIAVKKGKRITLEFLSFDLGPHDPSQPCNQAGDRVDVFEGDNTDDNGLLISQYCGNEHPAATRSLGNVMTVRFTSDDHDSFPGFSAKYTAD